jgi:hypothetical protein
MVDLTSIELQNGIPVTGTGTVATLNAVMADGGLETVGTTTDPASTATDATSVTAISLMKQMSKMLQLMEARWPAALAVGGGLKVQGDGNPIPVSVGSVPSHAVTNSGNFKVQPASGHTSVATLTPSATAYTGNDVLSGALTFAGIAAAAEDIEIEGISLMIARTGVQASEGAYRLHLYNVTPPSAYADNAPWDLPAGDRSAYLGFIDITVPIDVGSTTYVQIKDVNKRLKTAGANLYAYLVTIAGYTETADVHTVTLHARGV